MSSIFESMPGNYNKDKRGIESVHCRCICFTKTLPVDKGFAPQGCLKGILGVEDGKPTTSQLQAVYGHYLIIISRVLLYDNGCKILFQGSGGSINLIPSDMIS